MTCASTCWSTTTCSTPSASASTHQRDRVFTKEDLREDVDEMLQSELQQRIPQALKDEEGPWKLLAYLEEIQPPLDFPGVVFPSYPFRLALGELGQFNDVVSLRSGLLELAQKALKAENEHLLRSARTLMEKTEETLNAQLAERFDTLDSFIEGQREKPDEEDDAAPPRRPQEILEELSTLVRVQLRFSSEQVRLLVNDPKEIKEDVREQVQSALTSLTINRLIGTFERRLEEPLGVKATQFQNAGWNEVTGQIIMAVEDALQRREDRLLGDQGQIARDLDAEGQRLRVAMEDASELVRLLGIMSQGTRLTFDPKTHRRSMVVTTRLRYVYLAARLLEERSSQWITEDVQEHLEEAQEKMALVWGISEWSRLDSATLTLNHMDRSLDAFMQSGMPAERLEAIQDTPLADLSPDDRQGVTLALGLRVMNEIYRQLLLSVISELWVDYLTQVEALRVSIGLEAYAQRDPLVQYKGKASELFGKLLSDIRAGVISRMYVYRPRVAGSVQVEKEQAEAAPAPGDGKPVSDGSQKAAQAGRASGVAVAPPVVKQGSAQPGGGQPSSGSRRKRHRH